MLGGDMKTTLLNPFFWLILLNIALLLKRVWDINTAILHAQGRYTIDEWTDRLLQYSRANEYLGLEELEQCFQQAPHDECGRLIYLVHTDWWGVPLDFGLRHYPPELTLGYYTDGHSWTQITRYSRDKDGQLEIFFRDFLI